jgi:hypothetical protein
VKRTDESGYPTALRGKLAVKERNIIMLQIVLTDEQAKLIATALKPVQICDAKGAVLGVIQPRWTERDIEEALKELETNTVWHTTEQVLAHLQSLEKH